jgi:hypothetical protein
MAGRDLKLRFHAVSVIPGPVACDAARLNAKERVLSASAPFLPLPDCTATGQCTCTYRKFDDRRSGPRRNVERGLPSQRWAERERRRLGGRRSTDD